MPHVTPRVDIAERAGVGLDGTSRASEDCVVITPNAVALLDGATETRESLPSGGWYARRLAARIQVELSAAPEADLAALLAESIQAVALDHDLHPGQSPASTVTVLRWNDHRIDALVLADSPAVAFTRSGPEVLVDTRPTDLRTAGILRTSADADRLRNVEGGFWVAEADPAAAAHALRRSWDRRDVEAVLLATDGVSIGVDEYGVLNWPDALVLARERGGDAVLDIVRAAEHADPGCVRWPRSKRHDDQALAIVDFLS